jgi:hypothetical protein
MRLRKKPEPVDASAVAKAARYIQRAAQDPKVLDKGRVAIDSSRSVYKRFRKRKSSAPVLLNDKKLQKDLARAVKAIREALATLPTAASGKRSQGRLAVGGVTLVLTGAGVITFVWRDKLRSVFTSGAPGTGGGAGSQSPADTIGPSATPNSPSGSPSAVEVSPSSAADTDG